MKNHELIDLCDWYLLESGGDRWKFRKSLENPDLRFGQAFFNCLSESDQKKIRLTPFDPFYLEGSRGETAAAITLTLDFLTR